MVFAAQRRQNGEHAGRIRRRHERLEAELAHAQIGFEGERGEFPRQGVVVVFDGIGDNELLAVTAEATAFSEKLRKASVAARIIGSARIHHAESVALHLLRQQSLSVENAGVVEIAGAPGRFGERIDRIRNLAEKAAKSCVPRLTRVAADDGGVFSPAAACARRRHFRRPAARRQRLRK